MRFTSDDVRGNPIGERRICAMINHQPARPSVNGDFATKHHHNLASFASRVREGSAS
jgi:hypothetical protein